MFRYALLTVLAFLVLLMGYAYADQMIGIGGVVWSNRQSVTTTQACIQDGDSNCMGFPAGRTHRYSVSILSPDDARCCWSGDTTLSLSGFTVVDDAGVGQQEGSCFSFKDNGGRWDQIPYFPDNFRTRGGFRAGLCSVPSSRGGITGYLPCDGDSDCPSSGTCTSPPTSTQLEQALYYLICDSDTNTINMDFVIETIRG